MYMETKQLKRVFKYDKMELADPNPSLSTQDVLSFYSNEYPELCNATIAGPGIENDTLTFTFSTKVGTKG